MRFVQLILTDEQAELAAAALRDAEAQLKTMRTDADPETEKEADYMSGLGGDIAQVGRLSMLFQDASENPSKYPPTGKMASTVRRITRRAKGYAETPSRSRRRADRHQRRRAMRHFARRNREMVEGYNRAVEMYEAEQAEVEAARAEVEERIERQPKFTILSGDGQTIMSGIPAEFVIAEETGDSLLPKIIVPGSSE